MIAWLAGTLLATSLLMALVLLVREPVRRQFGPGVAYGLWLIPALRLVMPPLRETIERTVPAPSLPLATLRAAGRSVMPPAEPGLIEKLGGWETLAISAWLAGAAALLLHALLVYRRQRRAVLRDGVQLARLGTIRIVRSAAVRGPMAFGIFDRVIALPLDFDDRFDAGERRLALDHEIAHHRSGDLVARLLAFALLCLHWFNPLAWLSHAAFRFDQEAACDARVLAKSSADRAAYAKAIAKAASGRAMLFAGALDRPRTLHRRLASMLTRPSTGRRLAGNALIALGAAAALPLTASRATYYVDVRAPQNAAAFHIAAAGGNLAPGHAPAARASAAAASASSPAAGADLAYPDLGGVTLGRNDVAFMADDTVLIGGRRKRLEQLSAAERSRVRDVILRSRSDLARNRARLPEELSEAKREADRARSGELRREHMRDLEDLRRDLAEVDSRAAELRAEGEDPAKRKAEILRDLHEAEATDIDKEIREAIESYDPNRIAGQLRADEEQMVRMLARLDRLAER